MTTTKKKKKKRKKRKKNPIPVYLADQMSISFLSSSGDDEPEVKMSGSTEALHCTLTEGHSIAEKCHVDHLDDAKTLHNRALSEACERLL